MARANRRGKGKERYGAAGAFSLAVALVFVAVVLAAAVRVPATHTATLDEPTPSSTFMVMSDAQMTTTDPVVRAHLAQALTCVAQVSPDFLVFDGDLTDNGWPDQYALCRQLFADAGLDFNETYFAMGNHERHPHAPDASPQYSGAQAARFVSECDVPGLYYDVQTGAGHCIVLGPDVEVPVEQWAVFTLSDTQVSWLDQLLFEDEEAGTPSFVFMHEPLNNTTFYTGEGQLKYDNVASDAALRAVFARHPNTVFISGHTHAYPQVVQMFGTPGALAVNDSAVAYTRQNGDVRTGATSSCGMQVIVQGASVTFLPWDFASGAPMNNEAKTYFLESEVQ